MNPAPTSFENRVAQVIKQVFETGHIERPGQPAWKINHNVNPDEGRMLRDVVADLKPDRCVEIGMGTGLSGLHICWGLARAWGESVERGGESPSDGWRHLAIDPFQKGDFWQGVGLALRDQAGCENLFSWTGERNDQALPRLLAEDKKIQFALIDGNHRFEAALIDFYYIDKLLSVGGVCAIDDTDWPSVWRVVQFALRHRYYEWVDAVPIDQGPLTRPWGWKLRAKHLQTFWRQKWSLTEALRRKPYQFVVLRKTAEDDRPEHFWESLERYKSR